MRSSNGDFSNNTTDEYVLQVDWQVGENTVTSITSYSKYDFNELCDCDFTGANVFNVAMAEDFEPDQPGDPADFADRWQD